MEAKTRKSTDSKKGKKLEITLLRRLMGSPERQKRTVKSLGLRRRLQTVVHDDTPAIRGKVASVCHLVCVKEA
jgi:large subunit ribosomal protein L30